MPRATNNPATKARHKKTLKEARGAFGGRHRLYKSAKDTVRRGLAYAFADRRQKKRNYRALWISRIIAACRLNAIAYSRLINGLSMADVEIDRKMLSEIAIHDAVAFTKLVETARSALKTSKEPTAARSVPRI
ncbi:50S ribosomal protein L20 [Candidatus Poribacteria bacterium]|nr:50S ribosomal protein L20 [Candidatus Poribacteria bacterium]